MINEEAIKEIERLELEYEINWGKKVDYNVLPRGITQEKLVIILERIVDTGESILEGWNATSHGN
jgi:hypothetical protein